MSDILHLASYKDKKTLLFFSKLSINDIISVWTAISSYIKEQMTLQKGVHLPGLGTFTFSQQNLNKQKHIKIQQPIFILAGKLIYARGLKQTSSLAAATRLPVVQLNIAAVSQSTAFSRDVVEGVFRETLLLLHRALASEQNVSLTFKGIGVLFFKGNKVEMKFNKSFMNSKDGSGSLLSGLKTRNGSGMLLCPEEFSKPQKCLTSDCVIPPTSCSPQLDNKEILQLRNLKSNQTRLLVKLKDVNLNEEMNPCPPMEFTNKPQTSDSLQVAPAEVTEHLKHDLCHLCKQRQQRNIPLYLRDQQRMEEKAQEKLLLLNQQLRDKQFLDREQVRTMEQREHAKQAARFNVEISQKKKENLPCPVIPNIFIMPGRPLTPPRRIQQQCYLNDLLKQTDDQKKHKAIDQQNCLLMEHLNHIQLIQETALQGVQQLRRKQENIKLYKKVLDTQVENKKKKQMTEGQSHHQKSNRCATAVCHAERRERANELHQVNFNTASKRKEEEQKNKQLQLEKEKEMLRHNKTEFLQGCISLFEKKQNVSKSVEDDWSRSIKLKREREEEERRFIRSAGQLLVDKLEEYRRCCQCKKKTSNCGETNIWKDSSHLAGSQYMI